MNAVLVPSTLALLPQYAGLDDPVCEVRTASRAAVGWLVARHHDRIAVVAAGARPDNVARGVTEPAGMRVAQVLLDDSGFAGTLEVGDASGPEVGLLVVANGSAKRSQEAPGYLDERASRFDEQVGAALAAGNPGPLRELETSLGEELWAFDVPALRALGGHAAGARAEAQVLYADDPYGVQYWVVTWSFAP